MFLHFSQSAEGTAGFFGRSLYFSPAFFIAAPTVASEQGRRSCRRTRPRDTGCRFRIFFRTCP